MALTAIHPGEHLADVLMIGRSPQSGALGRLRDLAMP